MRPALWACLRQKFSGRWCFPTAGPGVAAGTVLTFARALGEYGATSMLAGNIPGKTGTISQKIAMVIQDGDYATAGFWVAIVLVAAFGILLVMNLVAGSKGKRRKTLVKVYRKGQISGWGQEV